MLKNCTSTQKTVRNRLHHPVDVVAKAAFMTAWCSSTQCITASCYVNDLEYGFHDIMTWLEKLAPFYGSNGRDGEEYHHQDRKTTVMPTSNGSCWASRSRCPFGTGACISVRGNRFTTPNLTVSATSAFW